MHVSLSNSAEQPRVAQLRRSHFRNPKGAAQEENKASGGAFRSEENQRGRSWGVQAQLTPCPAQAASQDRRKRTTAFHRVSGRSFPADRAAQTPGGRPRGKRLVQGPRGLGALGIAVLAPRSPGSPSPSLPRS